MADDNASNGGAATDTTSTSSGSDTSQQGQGAATGSQQTDQARSGSDRDSQGEQSRTRNRNADRQRGASDSDTDTSDDDGRKFSQADIDKAVEKRLARDRQKNGDVDAIKQERDDALAAQQQTMDNIAKALGLKKDDAPPDPAALAARIGELEAERDKAVTERDQAHSQTAEQVRAKDVELAAYRAGAVAGANLGTLMDSRAFLAQISKLDPADDGFDKSMAAAVKTALEANPAYRINQTASAAAAGIGSMGNGDAPAIAAPGLGRMKSHYTTNTPRT